MKKIAVGDLGEFWYGDYKEPFEQLEGGVPGHPVGVVLKADDGKILCAYCGKTYENLGHHVQVHGLSARTYKQEVGLLQKSALVGERLRLNKIAHGVRQRERMRTVQRMSYRTADRVAVQPAGSENGMWAAEKLNMHGRCYAQSLKTAESIVASGHRLTAARLATHGITRKVIERYFGSFDGLRLQLGQSKGKVAKYDRAELLRLLRSLASELGRTPSESDLTRHGLPTQVTYRNHFGSYPEACRQAGLDPNLPTPNGIDLDLRVVTAYATTGRVNDVASTVAISVERIQAVLARYGYPFPPGYKGPGRREWAADMARRLAGVPEQAVA